MKTLDAVRSAPFRYAFVFAALSSVIMGILLLVVYWWTTTLLERHMEEVISQQLATLKDDLSQDGLESMLGLVRSHTINRNEDRVHLLVSNKKGRVLAGDLPPIDAAAGWQDIELAAGTIAEGQDKTSLRGFGIWVDSNNFLLVTQDKADLSRAKTVLILSFFIGLAVMTSLIMVGGLVIGVMLLRQVEDVNRTARAIMNGDLSERISVAGWHGEMGGLAENLNRMLSRIDDLMQNLRHVTDSIAHDLRTPLSKHRQRLEVARMKERTCGYYESVIDGAIEDTDAILKTFEAMLRITQIESGTSKQHFREVNLDEIANNIVDAFAPVAEDDGKTLTSNIELGVVVIGDRELLTQMLVNLVENSLRHTQQGSNINLSIKNSNGLAQIKLTDDGPGIPDNELKKVFKRFYRGDASRSTPGNGIGLSLVAAVVKLHNATINLENRSPGLNVQIVFNNPD